MLQTMVLYNMIINKTVNMLHGFIELNIEQYQSYIYFA